MIYLWLRDECGNILLKPKLGHALTASLLPGLGPSISDKTFSLAQTRTVLPLETCKCSLCFCSVFFLLCFALHFLFSCFSALDIQMVHHFLVFEREFKLCKAKRFKKKENCTKPNWCLSLSDSPKHYKTDYTLHKNNPYFKTQLLAYLVSSELYKQCNLPFHC